MSVLGQLRFRLRAPASTADVLQQRCSTWFHSQLRAPLDTLLAPLDEASGGRLHIDRLIVDVGEIPLSRFEAVMSERVLAEIARQLRAYLSEQQMDARRQDRQDDRSDNAPAEQLALHNTAAQREGVTDRDHALRPGFAQLLRFLDTGYGSDPQVWTDRSQRDRWLTDMLTTAEAGPPRVELALRCLAPRARQRLIATFSETALSTLMRWLVAPTRLPIPAPLNEPMWWSLIALFTLQQHHIATQAVLSRIPSVSSVSSELAVSPLLNEYAAARGFDHEVTLNTWFTRLLAEPLPAPLRAHLSAWLREPVSTNPITTRLGWLSSRVRQQLEVVLGLPTPHLMENVNWSRKDALGDTGSDAVAVRRLPDARAHAEATQDMLTLPASGTQPRLPDAAPWPVANAGLILLWPLLPRWFNTLGLVNDGRFVDDAARWQALGCLDWLAWGDPELAEWRTPLSRWLCGIPWDAPFDPQPVSAERQDDLDTWLTATFAGLPLLNRCSVGDLRAFFFQRAGTLNEVEDHLTLSVEPDATDVLLQGLPWPRTQVVLPWLPGPLAIDWP
ncbi:contractile injection system tape measure protein [Burkholderia sp. SIMBA_062]|uniref:contractile injection system tape measure protein n=1 Tax=Burkholderia sp. SIMBA_062 TaxID=3085803 RepID=UPI00397BC161